MYKAKTSIVLFALAIFLLSLPSQACSQPVPINSSNFPDNTFMQFVAKHFDKDSDNSLSEQEAASVTSIDVRNLAISSLTGIEHFPSLLELDCSYNNLRELNVSANTSLRKLYCWSNDLTAIDVSHNTGLEELSFRFNRVETIGLSNNPGLKLLSCWNNSISTIDVTHNFRLVSLDFHNNNITGSVDLHNNPNLRLFNCYNSNMTELDITNNPAIETLAIDSNHLTRIDLSHNPALSVLYCGDNNLSDLDVSHNPLLRELYCWSNDIHTLTLHNKPALVKLECDRNNLSELDLTNCPALEELYCYNNRLKALDTSNCPGLLRLVASNNDLRSLSLSNNKALVYLVCGGNQLGVLDVSQNSELLYLLCDFAQLASLNLSNNIKLQELNCKNNHLVSLDLSANPDLTLLDCSNNDLTSLNLSANTALRFLSCEGNGRSILQLNISGLITFPYEADMKDCIGGLFTRVRNVKAYSFEGEIECGYSSDGTIRFADKPSYITYDYEHGYTGTASPDDVPGTVSFYLSIPDNYAILTRNRKYSGRYNTSIDITPELISKVIEHYPEYSASDIYLFSDIIIREDWITDETAEEFSNEGYELKLTLPETLSDRDGLFVVQCIMGNNTNKGYFTGIGNLLTGELSCITLDEDYNEASNIGDYNRYYLIIEFHKGEGSRIAIVQRENFPSAVIQPYRPGADVVEAIGRQISADTVSMNYITDEDIDSINSPNDAMIEYISNDHYTIKGIMGCITVKEAGPYVFMVTMSDNLLELMKGADPESCRLYVLNQGVSGFEAVETGSCSMFDFYGRPLKAFTQRFLLAGIFSGNNTYSNIYLADFSAGTPDTPKGAPGSGGCDSGLGVMCIGVLILIFSGRRRGLTFFVMLMLAGLGACSYAGEDVEASDYNLPVDYELYGINGRWSTDFGLTSQMKDRIISEYENPMLPDFVPEHGDIHNYSEIIIADSWDVRPSELYTISQRGGYGALVLPLAEKWPANSIYVIQCTFSDDVMPGETLQVDPFSVDPVTRIYDSGGGMTVNSIYVMLDDNLNRVWYVPPNRRIYLAVTFFPENVNTGIVSARRGKLIREEDIVSRLSPDFAKGIAEELGISVEELRVLLQRNIGLPVPPTQAMIDYIAADNHEIIGNLPTVSVDESGYYAVPVRLDYEVWEQVKSKDISDYKFYALNDSDLGEKQLQPAFINGLVSTWELFTLNGEKLDHFGVREFLMVGLLEAGKPFSLYLAKMILMLLMGGCDLDVHAGIIGVILCALVLPVFVVKRKK